MIRVLILPYLAASNLPTDLTGKIHMYIQKPKGNRPQGNNNFKDLEDAKNSMARA